MMHPLVRDLYKRVLIVGRDYPHPEGLEYVKRKWKEAIKDGPKNWPLNYELQQKQQQTQLQEQNSTISSTPPSSPTEEQLEEEIIQAVHRGRFMVKEMIGAIQLKKYREMKKRYE